MNVKPNQHRISFKMPRPVRSAQWHASRYPVIVKSGTGILLQSVRLFCILLFWSWLFISPSATCAGPDPAVSRVSCASLWSCLESPEAVPSWGGYKTKLEAMGIFPNIDFTGDFLGNVSGGKRRAFAYAGALDFGLSLDLEKLLDLKGLTFTISGDYRSGQDLSRSDIGNVLTVAQAQALTTFFGAGTVRLYNLYLEESLLDERLKLAAGRMGMGDYFLTADLYNAFVSAAINGNPIAPPYNLPGFSVGPVATWGLKLRYAPTESTYVMGGVFYADPEIALDSKQGVDFSMRSDRGAITILQLGYEGEAAVELPGQYYIGGYYDSNRFENVVDPTEVRYGNYGVYFYAQQMIYREGGSESNQGLTPFVSAVFAPFESFNTFPYYATGGLVYQGLIPGRDDDVAALGLYYGQFSGQLSSTYEMVLELTYNFQLTSWLSIQPDFQYVFRPGGTGVLADAVVLGWQIFLDL